MLEQEDRDMLIRIDENCKQVKVDVACLNKTVYGEDGVVSRLRSVEDSNKRRGQWPAMIAATCAIVAVVLNFVRYGQGTGL